MEHYARWIVKRRKLILVLAVLLLIPSVFGALGTYINYDILTYLPKKAVTSAWSATTIRASTNSAVRRSKTF